MDYGKALKIARALAGLQQKEVAELAGVNPSYISMIEMGKRQPSVKTIQKLSRALKMPTHLLTLLAAEEGDLPPDSGEMERVGESLTRLLIGLRGTEISEKPSTAKQTRKKH